MKNHERIDLQDYRCVNQYMRDDVRGSCGLRTQEQHSHATPHVLVKCNAEVHRKALVVEKFEDICAAEVMVKGVKALVVVFYISPRVAYGNLKDFFEVNLLMYNLKAIKIFESLQRREYGDIPMLISGDLNLDLNLENGCDFAGFMKRTININLVSDMNMVTTRGGTALDAVHACGLDRVDCKNFVSYFLYHEPILCKTVTNATSMGEAFVDEICNSVKRIRCIDGGDVNEVCKKIN